MIKEMLHPTRILMGHGMDANIIKVMVEESCSVGHVVRRILRGIL